MSLMMQAGLKNFTTHTLDNLNALKKDLQHARQQGFAQDSEEHVTGLNCLASAIFDSNNNAVAAISISGPSSRLTTERFTDLGELVRIPRVTSVWPWASATNRFVLRSPLCRERDFFQSN